MPTAHAPHLQRRSMLDGWHRANGAEFAACGDWMAVARYASLADERGAAGNLGLCDLSAMPRIGVTGAGAWKELAAAGYALPDQANRATRQPDGDVLARLSEEEYLLLGTRILESDSAPAGFPAWSDRQERRMYVLPRLDSHCCLAVTGAQGADLLSKLCPLDMRPRVFADGEVAQTALADVAGIVLRHDLRHCPVWLVLVSSAAAQFVFESVVDAMAEFGGRAVGLSALRAQGGEP